MKDEEGAEEIIGHQDKHQEKLMSEFFNSLGISDIMVCLCCIVASNEKV